jgi:hypothetical protein
MNAWMQDSRPPTASKGFEGKFYQFSERPHADSCWSLSTGPDGRIYAASCIEHTPGQSVSVVRYDEDGDKLEYLFDVDKVSGELRDNGHATQCKIHYSFAPSIKDNIMYSATHLSGAPKGEKAYCPWSSWHDEQRVFKGSFLTAYNTVEERIEFSDLMIPKEGCRCMALDEERDWLYAVTYPRDHFVIYDLKTKQLTDIGRIGSVNSQCIFSDSQKRMYFSDDRGHICRFDPRKMKLEQSPFIIPHSIFQDGWHGVIYDAVASPAGDCVYMVPWMPDPHLIRYWPEEGEFGRIEDLGRINQDRDSSAPISMSLDHVGGLVFGLDGMLYFVKAIWNPENQWASDSFHAYKALGVVVRMNPETLEKEDLITLERPDGHSHYVSRGARDHAGNIYFGHVGRAPVGIFRMTVPQTVNDRTGHLPLRTWG